MRADASATASSTEKTRNLVERHEKGRIEHPWLHGSRRASQKQNLANNLQSNVVGENEIEYMTNIRKCQYAICTLHSRPKFHKCDKIHLPRRFASTTFCSIITPALQLGRAVARISPTYLRHRDTHGTQGRRSYLDCGAASAFNFCCAEASQLSTVVLWPDTLDDRHLDAVCGARLAGV